MSFNWNDFHQIMAEEIPPIPPLPPLLDGTSNQLMVSKIINQTKETTNSYDISSETCSQYWNYITKGFEEDLFVVSLYNDVESVIQMGPKYISTLVSNYKYFKRIHCFRCGLVALLMSRSLVCEPNTHSDLTQNDLYETAKQMEFTKSGEMFSGIDYFHFFTNYSTLKAINLPKSI